ncbi:MAG: hypothetical protein Q8K29_11070 [Polaromonas sp.]|nr:hypothetical protein [Polaromonas sp.]
MKKPIIPREKIQSLKAALASPTRAREMLIPNFIEAASTTVFLVGKNVPLRDTRMFSLLLAYCLSAGKTLPPFTGGTPTSTLYGSGEPDSVADLSELHFVFQRDVHQSSRYRAEENLQLLDLYADTENPVTLNTVRGRAELNALLGGMSALVIHDLPKWMSQGDRQADDGLELHQWLAQLNDRGIAVIVFEPESSTQLIADKVLKATAVIRLVHDAAAPTEVGGGFNIIRNKMDREDPLPSTVQFWYKVFDGRMEFGYQYRDPKDPHTAKQVQIIERQIEVARLAKQGMPQKDIAEILEVDAATISRDLVAFNARATRAAEDEAVSDFASRRKAHRGSDDSKESG